MINIEFADFIYYFVFSSCMIPFCLLVDSFVNSSSEFFHGEYDLLPLGLLFTVLTSFVFAGWKVQPSSSLQFFLSLHVSYLTFFVQVLEYLKYCQYRYKRRDSRWRCQDKVEDLSLNERLRSLDLLCFSSQYYFMISVGSFGNILLLLCVEILVRIMHNPFGDKLSIFIISIAVAMLLVCDSLKFV